MLPLLVLSTPFKFRACYGRICFVRIGVKPLRYTITVHYTIITGGGLRISQTLDSWYAQDCYDMGGYLAEIESAEEMVSVLEAVCIVMGKNLAFL